MGGMRGRRQGASAAELQHHGLLQLPPPPEGAAAAAFRGTPRAVIFVQPHLAPQREGDQISTKICHASKEPITRQGASIKVFIDVHLPIVMTESRFNRCVLAAMVVGWGEQAVGRACMARCRPHRASGTSHTRSRASQGARARCSAAAAAAPTAAAAPPGDCLHPARCPGHP